MAEASSTNVVPDSVKQLVRAVLLSKIGGVPLHKFGSDYYKLIGENFPMRSLGFTSLLQCLQTIPDVVRMIGDDADTCMLLGVGDDTSFMSGPAIMAQYPVTVKDRGRRQKGKMRKVKSKQGDRVRKEIPLATNSRLMDNQPLSHKYISIVPNKGGVFTLVVKGIPNPATANKIYRMFFEDVNIVAIDVCNTYYFYRFGNIKDATHILHKYDGIMVDGTKLTIRPADEKGTRNTYMNPVETAIQAGNDTKDLKKSVEIHSVNGSRRTSKRHQTKQQSKYANNHDTNDGQTVVKASAAAFNSDLKSPETLGDGTAKHNGTSNHDSTVNDMVNGVYSQDSAVSPIVENNCRTSFDLEDIDESSLQQLKEYSIFVNNISKSTKEHQLMKLFDKYEPVKCSLQRNSVRVTGVAFVIVKSWKDVKAACKDLNNTLFNGKRIKVSLANTTMKKLNIPLKAPRSTESSCSLTVSSPSTTVISPPCLEQEISGDNCQSSVGKAAAGRNRQRGFSHTPTGISVQGMLETLPQLQNRVTLPSSDSEESNTSTRRRRPCILDFMDD